MGPLQQLALISKKGIKISPAVVKLFSNIYKKKLVKKMCRDKCRTSHFLKLFKNLFPINKIWIAAIVSNLQ